MDEKMSPTAAVDKATTDVESGQVTNLQAAPLRKLKSRHIQFIALGGTIGTGLFLGIGRALTQAGPLSLLLGYSLTGVAVCAMVYVILNPGRPFLLTPLNRCKVWARWRHGCLYLEPYLSFVPAMWMSPWDSRSDGMYDMENCFLLFGMLLTAPC